MSSMSGASRQTGFGTTGQSQTGETGTSGGVRDKIDNLTSSASEMAGQVRDTARQWAGSAGESLQEGWETTRRSVEGAYDEAAAFIRRHPAASFLAALGIGALIASCLLMMTEERHRY